LFLVKNEDFKKHKGEYLEMIVRKKGIKIKNLTDAVGYDRSTFYNHIKAPNLSFAILARYGKVLNHDFSVDYPELNNPVDYLSKVIETFEEMEKDRDYWRDRFLELAEKVAEDYKRRRR